MNKVINALLICIIIVTIIVGINSFLNNKDFFIVNAQQIITILIAVGISFFASQFKNDERKIKDNVERIIVKIQDMVNSSDFTCIKFSNDKKNDNNTRKNITINNRTINNLISVVEKNYSKRLHIEDEIKYIKDSFEEYNVFVSEHINNLKYLSNSETTLRRLSNNIDNKCYELIAKMY